MPDNIEQAVQDKYGAVAQSDISTADAGVRAVAEAFGYSDDELSAIPDDANMGLSCGNPTALANLREGETVVDLGCGGGIDVFLAAQKVGPTGKAIGIDMTAAMILRAQANAKEGPDGNPFQNVAFYLAHIDDLPLPDNSVDCVISNCVINLAPDKPAVFREIIRVLKPGGRLAVSDIALKHALPDALAQSVAAYVGCIAGALPIDQYQQGLIDAGFAHVHLADSGADLNAYKSVEGQSGCCSPAMDDGPGCCGADASETPTDTLALDDIKVDTACCSTTSSADAGASCCEPAANSSACCDESTSVHEGLADLTDHVNINDYAASMKIYAVKPGN